MYGFKEKGKLRRYEHIPTCTDHMECSLHIWEAAIIVTLAGQARYSMSTMGGSSTQHAES